MPASANQGYRTATRPAGLVAGATLIAVLAAGSMTAGATATATEPPSGALAAATPTPSRSPIAADLGPDCAPLAGALGRARDIMAGRLVLSRHTAVELPRNPTWTEDPLDDRNWEFQYHSLRFASDLFEAWRQTGDADFRDRGLFLLRDWVRDNPRGGGRSAFSWNDHSTALRTIVLACAVAVRPDAEWIRAALRTHAATLADPGFYVRHGNHALNQSRGLLAAGCVLGRRDWQRLATNRVAELLRESVDAEGVTNEQSVYYQLYNLDAYRAAADRLEACGIEVPKTFARLDRMTDLLTHATLPDRTYATLGDTSHARARSIAGTTVEFAATRGLRGPRPAALFASFEAGFAFGRTGWGTDRSFDDEIVWTARFGPGRRFHGHADHGSVTLYGYGRRLVDDPGLFAANANRWRAYALGRSAHNVMTVDGVAYDDSSTARLTAVATAPTHDDVTIRDRGYPGVELRRRIVFSRGMGWLLVDDRARSGAARTYRQLWHLLPDAEPRRDGSTIRTRQCSGNVLILQLRATRAIRVVEGRRSPMQGWYSTTLNKYQAAPVVEAVTAGRTVRYVTLLVPLPRRDSEVHVSDVSVTAVGVQFALSVDGRIERAVITGRGVTVSTPPAETPMTAVDILPRRGSARVDGRAVLAGRECNER